MTDGYATRDDALRALRAENANLRKVNAAQAARLATAHTEGWNAAIEAAYQSALQGDISLQARIINGNAYRGAIAARIRSLAKQEGKG
jgi:anti-sigma regulatory factor (Ser/Thr protein kinase)